MIDGIAGGSGAIDSSDRTTARVRASIALVPLVRGCNGHAPSRMDAPAEAGIFAAACLREARRGIDFAPGFLPLQAIVHKASQTGLFA